MAFAETLAMEGITASIGSIGDAYDNALAESTIGLFKNEAVRDGSPFRTGALRTIDDVESALEDARSAGLQAEMNGSALQEVPASGTSELIGVASPSI